MRTFVLSGLLFFASIGFDDSATAATATHDYVYLLSRGATPKLRSYRLEDGGALTDITTTTLPSEVVEGWTAERPVLSYAKKQKVLVVGLAGQLVTLKVAADGSLGPPSLLPFQGSRVDCVEVVEKGNKTFVYAGCDSPGRLYGYQLAADGTLTGLPGFPFATHTNPCDLVAVGTFLHSAEYGNQFVSTYTVDDDGSLSDPSNGSNHVRPEERCWQIAASLDGSTLYTNTNTMAYVQQVQRNPATGALIFTGLTPISTSTTHDSIIAAGKKLIVAADAEDTDQLSDVRFYKVEAGGRLRCISNGPAGSSGISSPKFMTLAKNDSVLLIASEASAVVRTFAVDKKQGTMSSSPVDSSSLAGLPQLATMLLVTR